MIAGCHGATNEIPSVIYNITMNLNATAIAPVANRINQSNRQCSQLVHIYAICYILHTSDYTMISD